MKMTYICSPCRGDYEKNIIKAQEYCLEAMNEGLLPIAPHVYFTQFIDDTNKQERMKGLEAGLQLLRYCQLIRVYGCKVSSGMCGEIQLAGVLGIEIEVYGPPKFIERVMAIYHSASVIQLPDLNLGPAAAAAGISAGASDAAPVLKVDLEKTQAGELVHKIEEMAAGGTLFTGILRGATD